MGRPCGRWPVLLAALLAAGCATPDPFAWRDDRPEPRVQVRQRRFNGTRRLFKATYAEVYRAAARHFDDSPYRTTRELRALYADDFHGMSSVGVFFHHGRTEDQTLVEALFLQDSADSIGAEGRRRREELILDGIQAALEAQSAPAPGDARGDRLDAQRVKLLGPPVSDIDELDGLTARVRPSDLALVIGAERHAALSDARYAARDAALFREYAETVLGVPASGVIFLADSDATSGAVLAALDRLRTSAVPQSRVWFYYAGFGGSDERGGESYLLTWDADPRHWSSTTVTLSSLYRALESLEAAQVTAVFDASFAGYGDRTWNEHEDRPITRARLPTPSSPRLTVVMAGAPTETAGVIDDQRHGVLTYYLLRGLRGEAALGKHLALEDLMRYLYRMITARGRRLNRPQTPIVRGPQEAVLW
ncbi:MAG: caspase family protein [Elusimicrobiota bacterium]|nr:caspase family protein [Elusimicrobiota bacterium]